MRKTIKFIFNTVICLVLFGSQFNLNAQVCSGSWATHYLFTYDCFVSQEFIGYQGLYDPIGCPLSPVYGATQTNTFTFTNPVNNFYIDFNAFSTAPGCGRMEIKINGIFYPLTWANLTDIPLDSGCTGAVSFLAISSDGYITGSALSTDRSNGQGRISITGINATSVTISTNDAGGTLLKGPYCMPVIPIRLKNFEGKRMEDCNAMISFETATEINVKTIELLGSANGIDFRKVADVKPKGSNSQYEVYQNNSSDEYFKLKTVDLDEHFDFSDIINVKRICSDGSYSLYPNPAHDFLELRGANKNDILSLVDCSGRFVSGAIALNNMSSLDIRSLSPGMYFLKITGSSLTKTTLKFVKY